MTRSRWAPRRRLEEVDDQTRLIVTRSGSKVCAAEVDGASRNESSDGALTVTVSGRTQSVDLVTCELTGGTTAITPRPNPSGAA